MMRLLDKVEPVDNIQPSIPPHPHFHLHLLYSLPIIPPKEAKNMRCVCVHITMSQKQFSKFTCVWGAQLISSQKMKGRRIMSTVITISKFRYERCREMLWGKRSLHDRAATSTENDDISPHLNNATCFRSLGIPAALFHLYLVRLRYQSKIKSGWGRRMWWWRHWFPGQERGAKAILVGEFAASDNRSILDSLVVKRTKSLFVHFLL